MSRLKLFLLLLIIGVLAIVFIQNREPIALKLLCADSSTQACLYQTPPLPLAAWIGLFTLGGIVTNLLGQTFSRYSYSGSVKPKYAIDDKYPDKKNWVDTGKESKPGKYSGASIPREDSSVQDNLKSSSSFESLQEPQSVERSGSNYSYKYRPADKSQNNKNTIKNNSIDLEKEAPDQDNEDWI
jgi:hypothetical protein